MQENAIYSVIAPEGAAAILYRDAERARDLAEALKTDRHRLPDARRDRHRRSRTGGRRSSGSRLRGVAAAQLFARGVGRAAQNRAGQAGRRALSESSVEWARTPVAAVTLAETSPSSNVDWPARSISSPSRLPMPIRGVEPEANGDEGDQESPMVTEPARRPGRGCSEGLSDGVPALRGGCRGHSRNGRRELLVRLGHQPQRALWDVAGQFADPVCRGCPHTAARERPDRKSRRIGPR